MTSVTLRYLSDCTSETEAKMKCDLIGERFDKKQYDDFKSLENWKRTFFLYNRECIERGLENILL